MAAWSHSSIKMFETCPRQYHEVRILKKYPRQETEATLYGTEFHEAAEFYIKDSTPLPEKFKYAKRFLDTLRQIPGDKYCELEFGLTSKYEPCGFNDPMAWFRGIADLVIVNEEKGEARVVDYKGLAVDTLIPTPNGFVRMGDLVVGDYVFGTDGKPCKITGKSQVKNLPCYEVRFTNGSSVVCDEEHLWGMVDSSVKNVLELQKRDKIPLAKIVEYNEKVLPIDPYVLGMWLADGTKTDGKITKGDKFVFDEIKRRGFELGVDQESHGNNCETRTVYGLRALLRTNNLLNNKHIPEEYMRGSFTQRLDLIRGILDGDGSVNTTRKQVVFMNINKSLSAQVKQLLSSLGLRACMHTTKYSGFGVTGIAYPVSFRPNNFNPFLTPVKADKVPQIYGGRQYLEIKEVVNVESVSSQCISVDSNDRMYLCTENYIPTHNTGKSAKYADPSQLELMALCIFAMFPKVKVVKGGLLFVVANSFVKENYRAELTQKYWGNWLPKVHRLETAITTGVWNPKKNNFCRKNCPVSDCEHHGG